MEPTKGQEFGTLLRRRREAAGWSQEELAARAGLTVNAIGALERGERRRPYPHTVQALADALRLENAQRAAFIASVPRRGDHGLAPAADGGTARAAPHSASLPAPLTRLIGRERDIVAVSALLAEGGVRLLTLLGPGGVGKTRLAIEVASTMGDTFPDGVAFVHLTSLTVAVLVVPAIAHALGVAEGDGRAPEAVVRQAIGTKRLLLVLDNFEHVLDAAPEVGALLAACPSLALLVTSRAALAIHGEHHYPVEPLLVPALRRVPTARDIDTLPAVRLFIERVRATDPRFALTDANAATLAAICRRLDGLPLALELAAARVKLLGVTGLLARLDRALPMLTGGARDLPARQRTMYDTIAWSYDLLNEGHRALLRRTAVFAGSWTVEAVEAICIAPPDAEPLMGDALTGMAALSDQSLVVVGESAGAPRFRLLETLRAYALERLGADAEDEQKAVQKAHALWYLALAEEAAAALMGPAQATWIVRLEEEYGNLRAALEWAHRHEQTEIGLRLATALGRFWLRSDLAEGRLWLETFLASSPPGVGDADNGELALRARALHVAGMVAHYQRDYAPAALLCEDSMSLYHGLGDDRSAASVGISLSEVRAALGEYDAAAALSAECLATSRALNDRRGVAVALGHLGMVAHRRREHARAAALYEECLATLRDQEDSLGIAIVLNELGELAHLLGNDQRARAYFEEGLARYRDLGNKQGIASALGKLGHLAALRGDHATAASLLRESFALFHTQRDNVGIAWCLERTAMAVRLAGDPAGATRLRAAAEALRATAGDITPTPDELLELTVEVEELRAALGTEAFAAAWADGQTITPERAIVATLDGAGADLG